MFCFYFNEDDQKPKFPALPVWYAFLRCVQKAYLVERLQKHTKSLK